MAKRHQRRGGRTTPKGTRPAEHRLRPSDQRVPPFVRQVQEALAGRSPLALLELAAGIVEISTLRPVDRWRQPEDDRVPLEQMLESLVQSDFPAMTALAQAILPMVTDELVVARTRRMLADVPPARHEPTWLSGMTELAISGTVEMVHILGDGDNVLVGWTWPDGHGATAVVYIDHNLGGVVKDAFVLPLPLAEAMEEYRRLAADPDQVLRPLDPADARARLTEAIAIGEITMPPLESDTWPMCRPLVEWVVSLLPDGGVGYVRPEWPDDAREELLARFVASPFAAELDLSAAQVRQLTDPLVWFGCDHGPGDPLRWSPVSVEIVLVDWYERKVLGDRVLMRRLPEVLAAFVRFAHAERGIRASLTEETLDAVERWTPDYLGLLDGPERTPFQGAEELARMAAGFGFGGTRIDDDGDLDDVDDSDDWPDSPDMEAVVAEARLRLEAYLGGPEAVAVLDADPLPDEPFDWSVVPDDLQDAVGEVLRHLDRGCDAVLDVEMRTISRRLLARLVVGSPGALRRSPNLDRLAAGIVAVACADNGVFGRVARSPFRPPFAIDSQKALAEAMGVAPQVVSQRLASARNAVGVEEGSFDAALSHSSKRRWYLDAYERLASWPSEDLDDPEG